MRQRTGSDLHEGNSHLCLLYIQANSSRGVSARSDPPQCQMTSLNTECVSTPLASYNLRCWSAPRPANQIISVRSQKQFSSSLRPSSGALFILLLGSSLTSPLTAFFPLHTHWYIPPPPSLLSEWPAPALRRMCCSRWPAVAARPASPWRRPVSASGRSPWTVARRPCKSGRTNRAGAPWAERRRGYSARAPTGAPGGRESTRTWMSIFPKQTHGVLSSAINRTPWK